MKPMGAESRVAVSHPSSQVVRDVPLEVEVADLLRVGRQSASRPDMQAAVRWAVERARALAEPAGVCRWLSVAGVEGEQLRLETGDILLVGEKADLLAPAREVLVFVDTIGPHLEREVRSLFQEGQSLEGYLLDCAGVLALASVGNYFRRRAEEEAARRGWGVSLSMAPGSLAGWPVSGQRALCALLDLRPIGVTLNENCILSPAKSGSGLVGIGPGYRARRVASPCRFCQIADTCWRRRP